MIVLHRPDGILSLLERSVDIAMLQQTWSVHDASHRKGRHARHIICCAGRGLPLCSWKSTLCRASMFHTRTVLSIEADASFCPSQSQPKQYTCLHAGPCCNMLLTHDEIAQGRVNYYTEHAEGCSCTECGSSIAHLSLVSFDLPLLVPSKRSIDGHVVAWMSS